MRRLGLYEYRDLKEFTKWDSGCEISGEGRTSAGRIPGVRHPGGMSAEEDSGCETSGWNVGGEGFRV